MRGLNRRTPSGGDGCVRLPQRAWPALLWAALICLIGAPPVHGQDRAALLPRAMEKATSIKERVDAASANPIVTYPRSLMEDIATFYREGVRAEGSEDAADAEWVNNRFVKPWVLGLYRDMFVLNSDSELYPENELIDNDIRLRTFLTREDAQGFRAHLTSILRTAREDLDPVQVRKLYRFLGRTLTPQDGDALDLLRAYERDDTPPDHRRRIVEALADINRSGAIIDE